MPVKPTPHTSLFHASVGVDTERLTHQEDLQPRSDTQSALGQKIVAISLILTGAIWLLIRLLNLDVFFPLPTAFSDPRADMLFTPALIILNITGVTFFLALWRRWFPILVAGWLFAGLALGEVGRLAYLFYTWSSYTQVVWGTNAIPFLWSLSVSAIGLQLLERFAFGQKHWWPMYSALGFIIAGFSVTAMAFASLTSAALIWLPLVGGMVGAILACRRTR